MPITRTAMIDDDGSGTTGTILNNAWKQELYGQIDVAIAAPLTITYNNLTTTDYNNFQPPGGAAAVVWALAPQVGPVNMTGILAEADGTRHLLINTTASAITWHNQHPNSVLPNRIIGPGYATYGLGTWASAWVVYLSAMSAWVIQKP